MAPGVDGSMDFLLAELSLRTGLITTAGIDVADCDHVLETLNRYKIENEQLMKFIMQKNAAMMALSTSLPIMYKNVAMIETEKRLLEDPNLELLSCTR